MKKKPEGPMLVIWCDCGLSLNARVHWGKRAKVNKAIRDCVGWQAAMEPSMKIDTKHPEKRRIVVTRFFGVKSREMDMDNAVGCAKPAIDALKMNKGAGVIVDDNPEWVNVEYRQEKTELPSWQGRIRMEVW